jgi:hypothetical protein
VDGRLYGVTIGSFTSLSLRPPLVLFSLDKSALCYPSFTTCTHFTVNVLAEDQTELSSIFASQDERPWDDLDFVASPATRAPRLAGCLAYIDCTHEARHPGGDHDIFIGGAIDVAIADADGRPLPQDLPDLLKLADAYGIPGFRIQAPEDLEATLGKARAIVDQPVLVEFRVDPDEMVFPMIPAGAGNDEILESVDEWRARLAAQSTSS